MCDVLVGGLVLVCDMSDFASGPHDYMAVVRFCFQAEDGIRDLVRSRGLGDVYKRQPLLGGGELGRS